MSPNEYKAMVEEFNKALTEHCKDESISLQIIRNMETAMQFGPDSTLYVMGGYEGYVLTNDGNNCNWQFIGNVKVGG